MSLVSLVRAGWEDWENKRLGGRETERPGGVDASRTAQERENGPWTLDTSVGICVSGVHVRSGASDGGVRVSLVRSTKHAARHAEALSGSSARDPSAVVRGARESAMRETRERNEAAPTRRCLCRDKNSRRRHGRRLISPP